ncbi:FPR1, partial [Symbiodinium pilosum]
ALQKMTKTTGNLGEDAVNGTALPASSPGVAEDLQKELSNPSVRGRVQDVASDPEKLAKVIHASPLVQQLAAMNPVAAQVINSPDALQKMFSKEMLDLLQEGQKPGDAMLESILQASQAHKSDP